MSYLTNLVKIPSLVMVSKFFFNKISTTPMRDVGDEVTGVTGVPPRLRHTTSLRRDPGVVTTSSRTRDVVSPSRGVTSSPESLGGLLE
jgi:hypothetical protein